MLHNSDNEWCSDDDWSDNDNDNDNDNDDWETVDIPNLIINEKEKNILEERKLVEEADAVLAKELCLEMTEIKVIEPSNKLEPSKKQEPSKKKESTIDLLERENRRKKQVERQRREAEKIRKKKEEKLRQKELYGEEDVDEYDEKYGGIADRY
jgi:Zn-dependent metalloprotease